MPARLVRQEDAGREGQAGRDPDAQDRDAVARVGGPAAEADGPVADGPPAPEGTGVAAPWATVG